VRVFVRGHRHSVGHQPPGAWAGSAVRRRPGPDVHVSTRWCTHPLLARWMPSVQQRKVTEMSRT
jgi:hypothetical protein